MHPIQIFYRQIQFKNMNGIFHIFCRNRNGILKIISSQIKSALIDIEYTGLQIETKKLVKGVIDVLYLLRYTESKSGLRFVLQHHIFTLSHFLQILFPHCTVFFCIYHLVTLLICCGLLIMFYLSQCRYNFTFFQVFRQCLNTFFW